MNVLKYLFDGLIIGLACFFIPYKKITISEAVSIGVLAAAVFSILDLYGGSYGDLI